MLTKNKLAIELSRLKGFEQFDVNLEQYSLDSEAASIILWTAFLNKDIENKVIADLGAGPGILAKGCLLLGAKKVYLAETDSKALSIAKENIHEKNVKSRDYKNHIVLIGARRMGSGILEALIGNSEDVVVVDFNPDIIQRLKEEGIEKIEVKSGDRFDEELHEAIEVIDSPTSQKENEEKIREVILSGWRLTDGPIIRHSKVRVEKKGT